jgi:beta-fructofuranosidase
MYFSSGYNPNEIGDFEVVEQDGQLHCFYLSLPSHDQIGHLVSDDGLNWRPLPAAIRTGEPGEFDDDQIWTMGVFRKGETWFMLYTALSERGRMQKVGLATSTDLIHWTKYSGNPVIAADARWYEAEQTGNYRVDWRDPHVIEVDGVLHGFLCARRNEGLLNRRGCASYFTSEDGYHWRVLPPAATPSDCFDFECPSVWKQDGRFYMAAIGGGINRTIYRVAERVEGPYRRPDDDSLLPCSNHFLNMSVRPCFWRGAWHLFHWQRGPRDWGGNSEGYAMLASPKRAEVREGGALAATSFDWSAQYAGAPLEINEETPAASSCGAWRWTPSTLCAEAGDGAAIWLMQDESKDFILRAEVTLDADNPAKEFGLVLRADETGDQGLFAACIPGRFAVELVKYIHNRRHGPQSLWRGRSVLQSHHLPPAPDGKYSLSLIAYGPSIEFNVNGRLALAAMSLPRRAGRLGLFAEDGGAQFSNVSVQPLRAPTCNWES